MSSNRIPALSSFTAILLSVLCSFLASCGQQDDRGESDLLSDSQFLTPTLPVLAQSDWGEYIDPVSGFQAQAPAGWSVSVLGTGAEVDNWFDSEGHAVTFQSPASSSRDTYSDYIMVELLPFEPAAGFIVDSADRTEVSIDGRTAFRERIVLRDFPVDNTVIDLVAYQLVTEELGYSMGLYVVGELREDIRLKEIFSTFLQHFVYPPNELQVSGFLDN